MTELRLEDGLIERLKERNTAILADGFDFPSLLLNDFGGTMLNLRKAHEALIAGKLDYYMWAAKKKVFDAWENEGRVLTHEERVSRMLDQFILELADAFRQRVSAPHVALVDPRNHADVEIIVKNAKRLVTLFKENGVAGHDLCVSIPATEAGIRAAQRLQKDRINVNLYLVTSLMHAAACAEAKAAIISVPVGPVLSSYEWWQKTPNTMSSLHPGIETIQTILAYFKQNSVKTKVMGTSFRSLTEIGLLGECDAICISPEQAERLKWSRVSITDLEEKDLRAVVRAQQVKYPTDMLTTKRDFRSWFSPDSRHITTDVIYDALKAMKSQMDTIEYIVRLEAQKEFDSRSLDREYIYRKIRTPKNTKEQPDPSEESPYEDIIDNESHGHAQSRRHQNQDEVF